jgi:hypothetical protein
MCEICKANYDPPRNDVVVFDVYWINIHCIELRRNRKARKNKKTQPKITVF